MTRCRVFYSKRSDMYHYAARTDYNGQYIRSANSHVCGNEVYSYATKIAEFNQKKEILLYTGHSYSNTTTNSMYELKRAFDHYKKLKVYDFNIKDAWNRVKVQVRDHVKYPATRKDDKEYFIEILDSLKNLIEYFGRNSRYLKTHTVETAERIATKYHEEMEAKRKRFEELAAKRREEDNRRRLLRIDRTMKIVREFMPEFDEEPKTFRDCMQKKHIEIPLEWMVEHHPEVLKNKETGEVDRELYDFGRRWNNTLYKYDKTLIYSKEREDFKILRSISRWSSSYSSAPDILVYDKETKMLNTSQHCTVDDTNGHVRTLLGMFLKAVDENKPTNFVIGKHCGPYEIREYNSAEKFLRVGCHCFLLENLREVYNDMQ